MTLEESAKILTVLQAAYPNAYRNISETDAAAVCAVWASQFADVPVDIVFVALQKAIAICKYPPTIAEIKAKLRSVHWDAYEAVNRNGLAIESKHGKEELEKYRRIYKATEQYRYERIEPTLKELLHHQQENQLLIGGS